MVARKRRGNPCSWQIKRLLAFADHEAEESRIYEMYCEKTAREVPFKVLSVMIFFGKEQYRKRPGSLVALYRVAHPAEGDFIPFIERYERYYEVLRERGDL